MGRRRSQFRTGTYVYKVISKVLLLNSQFVDLSSDTLVIVSTTLQLLSCRQVDRISNQKRRPRNLRISMPPYIYLDLPIYRQLTKQLLQCQLHYFHSMTHISGMKV